MIKWLKEVNKFLNILKKNFTEKEVSPNAYKILSKAHLNLF